MRFANQADIDALTDNNLALARETESKELDRATVRAGVAGVLDDPHRGFYVVCEEQSPSGAVLVGQCGATREWSDWRNGDIWWLQSVYVDSERRRQGVFKLMFEFLLQCAEADPLVVGLRLYVEQENERAIKTYENFGFVETPYHMLERIFKRPGPTG